MSVWYRFEDFRETDYDPWAEFEQPSTSHAALRLLELPVLRETPKGVWLAGRRDRRFYGSAPDCTFVLRESNKRWACPTIEEARESWRARKAKQIRIYEARIAGAHEALALMEAAERRNLNR